MAERLWSSATKLTENLRGKHSDPPEVVLKYSVKHTDLVGM